MEAQEVAGNEPTNERIRLIANLLKRALNYDENSKQIPE
jgi:hypothetical protein